MNETGREEPLTLECVGLRNAIHGLIRTKVDAANPGRSIPDSEFSWSTNEVVVFSSAVAEKPLTVGVSTNEGLLLGQLELMVSVKQVEQEWWWELYAGTARLQFRTEVDRIALAKGKATPWKQTVFGRGSSKKSLRIPYSRVYGGGLRLRPWVFPEESNHAESRNKGFNGSIWGED